VSFVDGMISFRLESIAVDKMELLGVEFLAQEYNFNLVWKVEIKPLTLDIIVRFNAGFLEL
jgi:hypothetical protein